MQGLATSYEESLKSTFTLGIVLYFVSKMQTMRLFHLNSQYLLQFMIKMHSLQKYVLNKHDKTLIYCSTWQLLFSGWSQKNH